MIVAADCREERRDLGLPRGIEGIGFDPFADLAAGLFQALGRSSAKTTAAPRTTAALAVARPIPDDPPIRTMRCPASDIEATR